MVAANRRGPLRVDYDRSAADYARHRGVHPGVVRELAEGAALGAASHVLDVGCGTGNYARALGALTGCQMSGVEPSAEMFARAQVAAQWDQLVQGPAECLPFLDGRFDLVMSTDVIHHVGDRRAYFREAARVLRPGGWIATVTDSRQDLTERRPLTSHFPETLEIELRRYPATEQLLAEMRLAGFNEVRTSRVAIEYPLTDIQPYRDRAFSSLLLIDDAAFARGLAAMERELAGGPIPSVSLYTVVWGTRAAATQQDHGEEA